MTTLRSLFFRMTSFGAPLRTRGGNSAIAGLVLCLCSLPATADMLYTNLGPAGDIYDLSSSWTVCGASACGTSSTIATPFTVAGSGNQTVTQIDLAVGYIPGSPATFNASIWTDVANLPGVQVANASWQGLSSTEMVGNCCDLVSVTGISGVNMISGQQYFMILGPVDNSDSSLTGWFYNYQDTNGLMLSSSDGGTTWGSMSNMPIAAFDVMGFDPPSSTPEPASFLLFGTGLAGVLSFVRRKSNC